ncbi:hypothetical protein [Pedobacter metabolipauper]|uniref:YhhN-like protein n=1 Tax=Pedobacter metabolipauper TaxID=425513 RepID=A0A4R6SXX0_9SPHI|nr:hypothetical protein [Pedobacter metabolipauper]TDQ11374.1 hypothetical protein ATK78_0492 [Pedobacter metabolipauper]
MTLSIQHYFEFLSLLTALLCIGKLKNSFLIGFVPYLFYILVIELSAKYIHFNYSPSTGWIYNISNLISQGFYAFIIYNFSTLTSHKKAIKILAIGYILFALIYFAFTSFTILNNNIISIGGIFQVTFACLYFYEYLKTDTLSNERHNVSGILIAFSLLLFYAGITICLALYNYIQLHNLTLFDTPLYRLIPRYLSIILYTTISIALILWKKPIKKSSSQ